MPLSRFSSETVGGSSGLGTGGPPPADGPVTLAVPTISPDIDDWRADAFELPLDEGLDFFRSERNGEPAAPDGLAEALPAFGPSNGAPVGAPVGNDATRIEPARAKAAGTAPPTARTQAVSRPAPAFIPTPIADIEPKGESTPTIAARPAQVARPRHAAACCSRAPSRNGSHAAGPSSADPHPVATPSLSAGCARGRAVRRRCLGSRMARRAPDQSSLWKGSATCRKRRGFASKRSRRDCPGGTDRPAAAGSPVRSGPSGSEPAANGARETACQSRSPSLGLDIDARPGRDSRRRAACRHELGWRYPPVTRHPRPAHRQSRQGRGLPPDRRHRPRHGADARPGACGRATPRRDAG